MANPLEFILKLTDMLTPGMRQAARISESSAGTIQRQFDQIGQGGRRMAASVDELRSRLDAINRVRFSTTIQREFDQSTRAAQRLERQIEQLENRGRRSSSSGGGGGILGGVLGGNLLSMAISKVGSMAMSAGGAIIGGSAKQEQQLIGLKTFLGDAGSKEAFANIQKDAARTPFDTDSLLMVNRALISAGLSAKDARSDTMNLANAISAVGGSNDELGRMAINMQQIKSLGKASAIDIKQFAFAGINIYKLLSDVTGKNINQVKDMDVSYELLSKALQHAGEKGGMYFGALDAQSKSVTGKWSTFMDNIKIHAASIGTSLQPLMHWVLDMGIGISDAFGKIQPYIQPVIDMLNSIPSLLGNITGGTTQWGAYMEIVKSYAFTAWETIKSIVGNVWHIVSGMYTWLAKSEMVKDIFWAIGKMAEGLITVIGKIGSLLGWIWDTIVKPVLDGIEWAYRIIKSFVGGKTEVQVSQTVRTLAPGGPVTPVTSNGGANPVSMASGGKADNPLAAASKGKSDSINSGGQRTIHITIGKQIEKLEVHVMSGKETAQEIEAAVREAMRRVVYSMNGVAAG